MSLVVGKGVLEQLLAEAAAAHPRECCGLLLGADAIDAAVPAANVAAEPDQAFEIDPAALIAAHKAARAGGPALAGYYHSHPTGPAQPSRRDREGAPGDGLVWAIVAEGKVTLWRDTPGRFVPLSYFVADR